MAFVTVVVKTPTGTEEVRGDALEVDADGSLRVFNTSVTAQTTTKKKLFGRSETTTEIEHKRYTSAVYAKGWWSQASQKTASVKEANARTDDSNVQNAS